MSLKSTITAPPVIESVTQVNSSGDTYIAVPTVNLNPKGELRRIWLSSYFKHYCCDRKLYRIYFENRHNSLSTY